MSRKEQAATSRASLVESARRVFTERGYEATTVAEVLDRAGMARGALYHYFPGGKRELFVAVFDVVNGQFTRRRDTAASLPSPLARLRAGIHEFLGMCQEDDFACIALTEAPKHVPSYVDRGSSYGLLREQLELAAAAGEIHPLDVEALSVTLYGAVRAAGEYVAGSPDHPQAARTACASLDLLIDGLAASPRTTSAARATPTSAPPPGG
jgi:AcrR family transcriptional regulator